MVSIAPHRSASVVATRRDRLELDKPILGVCRADAPLLLSAYVRAQECAPAIAQSVPTAAGHKPEPLA